MLRLFHTVRHLKPVQIYSRLYRRPRLRKSAFQPAAGPHDGLWTPPIPRESSRTGDFRFRFLNREHTPAGWNDPALPKLWLYNLHYFESPEPDLIARWIAENPPASGNGWEPYPLSLRICNWIKYAFQGGELDAAAITSLAYQAHHLAGSLEYHLLANHLFVNAKALVFVGIFFNNSRWLNTGLRILREQISEQVLPDGGHFERSPMYHSLILEDLLDLLNLARVYPGVVPASDIAVWAAAASAMLGWLPHMCHPDGRISFFNDAALAVAPEPAALAAYAARLGLEPRAGALGASGYIRLEQGTTVALFDAAPLGPDYQPGHAHADTLSFELSHNGRRVLVNSGTSTYEPGPERLRQRATPAHNTVSVDGADSSEVWSSFRVARRARPFNVSTDHRACADASHGGYRRLKSPVTHRRALRLSPGALAVTDTLLGSGSHAVELHFHLHPDASPEIRLDPRLLGRVEPSTWHPEFNLSVPNRRVTAAYRGPLPVTFETQILLT